MDADEQLGLTGGTAELEPGAVHQQVDRFAAWSCSGALIEEVRFAAVSLLEEDGFEPSVPPAPG